MSQAKPIITQTRVEAYIASALRVLGWLLGVILRINPVGRSVRLKHLLGRAELAVECILLLKAMAQYGPLPRRRHRPRSTPPGFRRATCKLRLFLKGAKVRARKAGALTRVLALIEALTHPERAVAYFFKRLCNTLHLSRLVAAAPPAHAFARDAMMAAERAYLDTS